MNAELQTAIEEWGAGRYYEAHEHLEEVAEAFEEADPSYEIALALVHVTASFHKLEAKVGPRAVPAKLERALRVLRKAPPVWEGLALGALVEATEALLLRLEGVSEGRPPPSDLVFPKLSPKG